MRTLHIVAAKYPADGLDATQINELDAVERARFIGFCLRALVRGLIRRPAEIQPFFRERPWAWHALTDTQKIAIAEALLELAVPAPPSPSTADVRAGLDAWAEGERA